jgi:hypothetical protein
MKRLLLFAVVAIAVSLRADENPYRYNVIVKSGEPKLVNAIVYGAGDAVLMNESSPMSGDQPLTFSKASAGVVFTIRVIPVMNGEVTTTFVAQRGNNVLQREEKTIPSGKLVSEDELITLELKEADLNDVLNTFAQVTGRTFTKEPGVTGTITIHAASVSWQVALTRAVAPLGLWPRMMEDGSVVLLRMPK